MAFDINEPIASGVKTSSLLPIVDSTNNTDNGIFVIKLQLNQ